MNTTLALETLGHTRLVALVRHGLQVEIMKNWMDKRVSSIWYKISSRGCKTLYLTGVYREQTVLRQMDGNDSESEQKQNLRWKVFMDQWQRANRLSDCIVLGDFNLDKMKWDNPNPQHVNMTNMVKTMTEMEGSIQMVSNPTHFWQGCSNSLLDQLWSNCAHKIISVKNLRDSASDHSVIEATIKLKGKIGAPSEIRKRTTKNFNIDLYRQKVADINWTSMYNSTSPSLTYGIFEEHLRTILDDIAPMKTYQLKNNYKPWVQEDTIKLMKYRDQARNSASISGDPAKWNEYKTAKNKVNTLLKKDKENYLKNKYKRMEEINDISNMYKVTREQLGWNKSSTPQSFLMDGQRISSPVELANIQLSTFNNKVKALINNLPASTQDPLTPLKEALEDWGTAADSRPTFKFNQLTLSQVAELLRQLGTSKTFGNDELDSTTLKLAATTLLQPIQFIVNQSLQTQIFPNQWKIAKLLPLHKGKGTCPFTPSNYRPISILPVVSKILEKAVQNQMIDFLNTTKQINSNHHAYRKKFSTTSAILQLTDRIYRATDRNLITTLLTIDESSAFDCVPHGILLQKMKLYNFSDEVINWFTSYLTGRSQYVEINAKKSRITTMESGVPQGSVLGPLVYTLYINELPNILKDKINCLDESSQQTRTFRKKL